MKRNAFLKCALIAALVVMMVPFGALSQQARPSANTFSQQELDQMLEPIALYPDSLLAQILIAATYPGDVGAADRWAKEHKGLSKDKLNAALDKMNWDESVKELVHSPQVLAMTDEYLDWTTKLGNAFMAQQSDVAASVDRLRGKAYARGNLKSDQRTVSAKADSTATSTPTAQQGTETQTKDALHPTQAPDESGAVSIALQLYYERVRSAIREEFKIPDQDVGNLETSALVVVSRHGRVLSYKIEKPSGNSDFDEAVVRAIRSANIPALPPPVTGRPKQDFRITFSSRGEIVINNTSTTNDIEDTSTNQTSVADDGIGSDQTK